MQFVCAYDTIIVCIVFMPSTHGMCGVKVQNETEQNRAEQRAEITKMQQQMAIKIS